jgi:hypothetical protein
MTPEQILQELNIEAANDVTKASVLAKIATVAETRLVLLLDEILSDEQRARFEELEASKTPDAASDWFVAEFPQLQDIYAGIVQDVVAEQKERLGNR